MISGEIALKNNHYCYYYYILFSYSVKFVTSRAIAVYCALTFSVVIP